MDIDIPSIDFNKTKGEIEGEIFYAAQRLFQKDPSLTDPQKEIILTRLDRVLKQASFNLGQPKSPATQDEVNALFQELKEIVIAVRAEEEVPKPESRNSSAAAIYDLLLTDSKEKPILNLKDLLCNVFIQKDPRQLEAMRKLLKNALQKIPLQGSSRMHLKSLTGSLLSLYTFFDPQESETLFLPIEKKEGFALTEYAVEKIYLTPNWMGSRIVAFGLTPQNSEAPPLLVFKGTSYPTDEGFALGLLSDLNIGASVGTYPFILGKKTIKEWLEKAYLRTSCKTELFGLSLGGALVLHTVSSFPDLVSMACAYSPPALFNRDVRVWDLLYGAKSPLPEVFVFYQENDVVPANGFRWGKGWHIYRVLLKERRNFLLSHIQCFLARKEHLIIRADRKRDEEKLSRRCLASLHLILSIPLFLVGSLYYFLFCCIRSLFAAGNR